MLSFIKGCWPVSVKRTLIFLSVCINTHICICLNVYKNIEHILALTLSKIVVKLIIKALQNITAKEAVKT